jgi:hypothetical protein
MRGLSFVRESGQERDATRGVARAGQAPPYEGPRAQVEACATRSAEIFVAEGDDGVDARGAAGGM